ncbi:MAG: tetratricopeptide repeat protein [Janthinobacterium lividum]
MSTPYEPFRDHFGDPDDVNPSDVDPDDVDLRRAAALGEAGRWEQALQSAHAVLGRSPHHAEALRWASVAELSLARPVRALQAAQASVAVEPHAEHGHRLVSVALLQMRRPVEAVEAARAAVRCAPHEPYAVSQLATALAVRRRTRRAAVAVAKQAVALGPGMAEPLFALGLVHQQRGNFRPARRAYEAALAIEPDHSEALNNLGAIALNSARLGRGAQLLGDSLAVDPHSDVARHNVDVLALGLSRRVWLTGWAALLAMSIVTGVQTRTGTPIPLRALVLLAAVLVLALILKMTWRSVPPALRIAVRQRLLTQPLLIASWVFAALLWAGCVVLLLLPRGTLSLEETFQLARVIVVANVVFSLLLRRKRPGNR